MNPSSKKPSIYGIDEEELENEEQANPLSLGECLDLIISRFKKYSVRESRMSQLESDEVFRFVKSYYSHVSKIPVTLSVPNEPLAEAFRFFGQSPFPLLSQYSLYFLHFLEPRAVPSLTPFDPMFEEIAGISMKTKTLFQKLNQAIESDAGEMNEASLVMDTLIDEHPVIQKEKIILLVIGATSAGKSTVINFLLSRIVLPFCVSECTSKVTKIIPISNEKKERIVVKNHQGKVISKRDFSKEYLAELMEGGVTDSVVYCYLKNLPWMMSENTRIEIWDIPGHSTTSSTRGVCVKSMREALDQTCYILSVFNPAKPKDDRDVEIAKGMKSLNVKPECVFPVFTHFDELLTNSKGSSKNWQRDLDVYTKFIQVYFPLKSQEEGRFFLFSNQPDRFKYTRDSFFTRFGNILKKRCNERLYELTSDVQASINRLISLYEKNHNIPKEKLKEFKKEISSVLSFKEIGPRISQVLHDGFDQIKLIQTEVKKDILAHVRLSSNDHLRHLEGEPSDEDIKQAYGFFLGKFLSERLQEVFGTTRFRVNNILETYFSQRLSPHHFDELMALFYDTTNEIEFGQRFSKHKHRAVQAGKIISSGLGGVMAIPVGVVGGLIGVGCVAPTGLANVLRGKDSQEIKKEGEKWMMNGMKAGAVLTFPTTMVTLGCMMVFSELDKHDLPADEWLSKAYDHLTAEKFIEMYLKDLKSSFEEMKGQVNRLIKAEKELMKNFKEVKEVVGKYLGDLDKKALRKYYLQCENLLSKCQEKVIEILPGDEFEVVGGEGVVRVGIMHDLGSDPREGQKIAVKVYQSGSLSACNEIRNLKYLQRFPTPYFGGYLMMTIQPVDGFNRHCLALPYYPENLNEFLERNPKIPIKLKKQLSLKIVRAVELLHDRDMWHRDLKPENIMISGPRENPIPVIIDYGMSRIKGESKETIILSGDFTAPEMRAGGVASKKTDVYTLGLIVKTILGDSDLSRLSSITQEMIKNSQSKTPNPRPTVKEFATCLEKELPTRTRVVELTDKPSCQEGCFVCKVCGGRSLSEGGVGEVMTSSQSELLKYYYDIQRGSPTTPQNRKSLKVNHGSPMGTPEKRERRPTRSSSLKENEDGSPNGSEKRKLSREEEGRKRSSSVQERKQKKKKKQKRVDIKEVEKEVVKKKREERRKKERGEGGEEET